MKLEQITPNAPQVHGHHVILKDESGDVSITIRVNDRDPGSDLRAAAIADTIKDYMNNRDKFLRRK